MALERLRFLLSVASSQNPSGLKEAEAELRLMETQPQFHIALLVRHLHCAVIINSQFVFTARSFY